MIASADAAQSINQDADAHGISERATEADAHAAAEARALEYHDGDFEDAEESEATASVNQEVAGGVAAAEAEHAKEVAEDDELAEYAEGSDDEEELEQAELEGFEDDDEAELEQAGLEGFEDDDLSEDGEAEAPAAE